VDYWVDGFRKRERASGDKEMALSVLAAKRTDIERGELGFEKKQLLRFSSFAEEYKRIKASSRSICSIRGYIKHLSRFFGDLLLSKITPEMVEGYKQRRFKQKIRGQDPKRTMKGSSINRELAVLKNIFSVALKQKRYRGDNPVRQVSYFPEQNRDYVLSKEEIGRLLEAAGGTLRKIILIALNTGFRKGEILSLRWNQVNFEEGIISFARTKSAKFLRVPMNQVVRDILAGIEKKGDYVFLGRGSQGHLFDCKKQFEAAREKAVLPGLRFHDLRHCAGTYMAAASVPLATIQQILGHQDIRTTMRYINPNDEGRRKAVSVLGALFADPGQGPGTNVTQEETRESAKIEISIN
jgi:integrase